ncbi:ArdC-like ssDNA-binding domain-containing protein [Diaminobutyricibacter sp. McL0608]|uniref:ArdC-like ssDNA-binding domain-containing protein n=1 Tax=Leifsonia sp. McL0608 TaxID=3143537 RepID=UPI0031F325CE
MTTTSPTRARRFSATEQKARAAALHASIIDQVEMLRNTDIWRKFLQFSASFHEYSLNNVLLILSQRPDATAVAGHRAWQSKGRQVRSGEHGIHIFGYRVQKVAEPNPGNHPDSAENEEAEHKAIARFPILTVFDIAQTDPIEGETDPTSLVQELSGTDDFGIVDRLTDHLRTAGWTISRRPLAGGLNGYADPSRRQVGVKDTLTPEHAAKTLIHETAHILLGHTENLADYAHHRGLAETEAESVAYVVAGLTGFDTSGYSIGYIAGWADADSTLIASTATRVLHAVHAIMSILEPTRVATD